MKLRYKHTRNSPDVLHREFSRRYRIAKTGTGNDVPDKMLLSFDTWHSVEGVGRLVKSFSNEFAACSGKTEFSQLHILLGFALQSEIHEWCVLHVPAIVVILWFLVTM